MKVDESDQGFAMIVEHTSTVMGVSIKEATSRVRALYKSDLLRLGGPDNPLSQAMVDCFLQIPSNLYHDKSLRNL